MYYRTQYGTMFNCLAEDCLVSDLFKEYSHSIDLIFTSPPFPLNRKKKYGNEQGEAYLNWLKKFSNIFRGLLKPTGSVVIEVGNCWEKGSPIMSTLPLKSLLAVQEEGQFYLCQQFIYYNPARLPGPAQWVNIERIRVKDSFTHLWWMSPSPRPKANNRNVLKQYSPSMIKLIETQKYNSGKRPSEHNINPTSFLKNNSGAIPSNVISISNNESNTRYLRYCKENQISPHPARMPMELVEFFIKLLTDPNDIVLDPFAGSNTTGAAAEKLSRRWISIEPQIDYLQGSMGRFDPLYISIYD
jgi:DNA modification methylase